MRGASLQAVSGETHTGREELTPALNWRSLQLLVLCLCLSWIPTLLCVMRRRTLLAPSRAVRLQRSFRAILTGRICTSGSAIRATSESTSRPPKAARSDRLNEGSVQAEENALGKHLIHCCCLVLPSPSFLE